MAIKLLIGGSPCTHWSIAQKNNRETAAEGLGWELFRNYLIAKEKFNPDFFLYENNKSAAQAIKDQIAKELGVGVDPKVRFTYINSALASAQNRQRFYVTNFGDIEQPEDRGILLKDILEGKYARTNRTMVAESVPFGENANGKAYCLDANYWKGSEPDNTLIRKKRTLVAEPVCMRYERSEKAKKLRKQYEAGEIKHGFRELSELHPRTDGKTNTLTTVLKDNPICEPVRVGQFNKGGQGDRVYSIEGKSVCLSANGGGRGAKTGLYAIPVEFEDGIPVKAISCSDGKTYPVYRVENGLITIKEKQYDIKLPDGYYIIRKLTVTECCRLQTMPDDYCKAVSAAQAYKGLGNGWTAEVIIHLLNHALKDVPKNEEIVVLSLYDGIGTGRYCLDKMGFTNIKYHAYEIDKHPMAIANDNYPDIIQHGDAFVVREDSWKPPQTRSEWLDELLEVTA
jgi:DNA (cytosine-5)-methyltransferase 3A